LSAFLDSPGMSRPLDHAVRRARSALSSLREPATQTDLLQVLKSAVAAVVAWVLAVRVFHLEQPFLVPWAALVTVHATVYRSLRRGVESVLATGLGVLLSYVVAELLGVGALTLGVVLVLGMLLARAGVLREEGVTVATTALFVLTTGYEHDQAMLLERLADTALGVAVGILVNLVVLPPLDDRSAQQQVERLDRRLGELLTRMAEEMRSTWDEEHSGAWIDRTRELDDDLERAWRLVRHSHESGWWNPRRLLSGRTTDPTTYEQVLLRIEEGIAQTRSMARVVHEATREAQEWDPAFRDPWLDLLRETGARVQDPDAEVRSLHGRVDDLTRDLSREDLPGLFWPVYGALLTNLVNIIDIVDDVATSQPVRT
jgi:hypothetical protein